MNISAGRRFTDLQPICTRRVLPGFLRLRRKPPTLARIGAFAALLRPVGVALAIVIVGVPCIFAWNIYTASETRRALHENSVPAGTTTVETSFQRKVRDGEVELHLRRANGEVIRVIAGNETAGALANKILAGLQGAQVRARQHARADLDAIFANTFATRSDDLDRYADWYFEWGRSWRLLYEAITGAMQETLRMGFSRTPVNDAARHAVEDYLLRHYQEFVLKPGVRDPMIVAGVISTFRTANAAYRTALASLDSEIQAFLAGEGVYVETVDDESVKVTLDWDAEKWRAPRQSANDRFLEPVRTAGMVAGGTFLLGPAIDRIAAPFFSRATGQVLASTRMAVAGASLGSIEPGLGTAVGAAGGLALDWGINAFQDWMGRDEFVADNAAALDATIAAWKEKILPEIDRSIDVWFSDARAAALQIAKQNNWLEGNRITQR
jgi:hypothetical protein